MTKGFGHGGGAPTMQRPSHAALDLFEPGLCEQLAGHEVRPKQVREGAAKVALVVLAWLPIAFLAMMEERAAVSIPLFRDFALHVRLLFELPCLLFASYVASPIVKRAIEHARVHLVPAADRAQLDVVVARTRRMNRSPVVALVVFAVAVAFSLLELRGWYEVRSGPHASSWRFHDGIISPAGMWFVCVARPIFYAQLSLWLFRFALWTRILFVLRRIARPVPAHPDGFGGLSPVSIGHEAFAVIALVIGADLAASVSMRLVHLNQSIGTYRVHIAMVIVCTVAALLSPLVIFAPSLYDARLRATFTFGGAASIEARYVDTALRRPKDPAGEGDVFAAHIHTAESLKRIRDLRLFPIHRRTLTIFVCAVAIPFVLGLLVKIPVWQILVDLHKLSSLEPLR